MSVGFPIIVVVLILVAALAARQPDRAARARILRRAGFGVVAFVTAFFGLFVAGEAFTDPGRLGGAGVGRRLAAAVALLGLRRTVAAGVLLLILGVVPVVVSSLGSQLGFASLAVVSSAPFVAGVLYLCSAALAGRSAPPLGMRARPQDGPKAA
jgi:hypothetical protein